MSRYYYDFHIHSCLSPCADDDMTPANIAGMSKLAGLDIAALTDHNTCKNCPAFFTAAQSIGIIPIAGMELTTQEDIHVVCLFERLDEALAFDKSVDARRIRIKNKPDIFGNQYVIDENDNIVDIEPFLLPNATSIDINEAFELTKSFNGVCFPAHIDREANGLIATLGTFPDKPSFQHAEFHDISLAEYYAKVHHKLNDMMILSSSDAHYLWDIRDKANYFEIDDGQHSHDFIRKQLFYILRRQTL